MASDDLLAAIMRDYPSFAFLVNDPTFTDPATGQNLLLEAVDPSAPFDQATFQAKLLNTDWWKTHGAAARQWQVTLNTDPASAQAQKDQRFSEIGQVAARSGFNLSDAQIGDLTERSLMYGVASSSSEFSKWLAQMWTAPGIAAPEAGQLKAIAEGQYMIHMGDQDLAWWAAQIGTGFQSQAGFTAMLAQQAKGRFPTLAAQIDAGVTPGTYFAPYRSTIAQQLEVSPDSINLMDDPRWSQVLGVTQGDGSIAPMTLSQSIDLARSQPEWRNTDNANAMASDLATKVLTDFGAIK